MAVATCCALIACGGGGGGGSTPALPGASPAPQPSASAAASPSPSPAATVYTASLQPTVQQASGPSPTPLPVALPAAAGISGQLTLPAAATIPAGTVLDEQLTNQAPGDAPLLQSALRRAAALRPQSLGQLSVIFFLRLTFSNPVTLPAVPDLTVTLPAGTLAAGNAYYLALFDTANPAIGWQNPFAGPATVAGSTLAFAGPARQVTFTGRVYLALYGVSASATPAPLPATSPTAAPTSAATFLTAAPSLVNLIIPGQTIVVTANRPGYTGTYTATIGDPSLATVVQTGPTTFAVTELPKVGTTALTITDQLGGSVTVPVLTAITSGIIS